MTPIKYELTDDVILSGISHNATFLAVSLAHQPDQTIRSNGTLTIHLPRYIIDSKYHNGGDAPFVVFVKGNFKGWSHDIT